MKEPSNRKVLQATQFKRVWLAGLLLSCLFTFVAGAQTRDVMSLDGIWNFATDPANRGEAEKWYQPSVKLPTMPLPGYAPTANGTIRVPGIWDNQGYGTETDKVRHNFVGKGWYRRQVTIPQDWTGRRVFLAVTGVSRYAKVWINDHFLGEHIGFLSALEHDISDHVLPGRMATISIQVDSKPRWNVDPLYGTSTTADYMDLDLGGIWGHVSLEARSDAWLSGFFIAPNLADRTCTVSAELNGNVSLADSARLEVFDKNNQCCADVTMKLDVGFIAGRPVRIQASLPGAELWTDDNPVLYMARMTLLGNGVVLDGASSRFGMRQFTVEGFHLLLNGKRIMLRGYGDDHIYPEQMPMPCDKELHLARLRLIKSYGFNHVRHHSTMMPPEYYDACDEVGMITTAEFPLCAFIDIPGSGTRWQKRVPPNTDPAPAIETCKREWSAVIRRHRNHPCILCWVMGNELYNEYPLGHEFKRIARDLDPLRFFADSNGVWGIDRYKTSWPNVFKPWNDRDTLDLYFMQFNEFTSTPFVPPSKYECQKPAKPVILHEIGNYLTFSRPDLIDQFIHNIKPFWLKAGRAKLEELGLLNEAKLWAEKSERLYTLSHKFNIELARRNPFVSGYHWWLFQDYWTTSNGIVDHYFRPKAITTDEILKINNEVVLLQDGLERTYRGKSRMELKLLLSNYSPAPLKGDCVWEVKIGDQSIARRQLPLCQTPQGEVVDIAQVDLELPDPVAPAQIKLSVELSVGDRHYSNNWSAWLYPAVIRPAAFPVPVFAAESQIKKFSDWGVQPIPANGDLGDRAVYVTDTIFDHRVIDAMERGASVVFLGVVEQVLTPRQVTFKTSWWKAGDSPKNNNCGTFVYDHPITRAMAPDGWCDAGWFDLIEGGKKYVLEGLPARPNVIIRGLPSMALIEDDALLFEVGVGKGSLIVSGLNHQRAGDRPENQWLLARLLDHAAALSQPKAKWAKWPALHLSAFYAVPEGCLPGFRSLITNEGEDSAWFSYREDSARVFICRQTKPGNRITWETIPLPKESTGDRITFVFAGGLGYFADPKTEGFALEINGKEMLRFDLPEPKKWESTDKRVELRFEPRKVSGDQLGLFYVTIARDMLTPGKPCQLGVRSLGTGSRRWFGLNPYTNTK